MYTVIAYSGLFVFLAGVLGAAKPAAFDFGWEGMPIGICITLLTLTGFAYVHRARLPDPQIPDGSFGVFPAFRAKDAAKEEPGLANIEMIHRLAAHAHRFREIWLQEAGVWALHRIAAEVSFVPNPVASQQLAGHLKGTPVYRIHRHVLNGPRTLETLVCAFRQLLPVRGEDRMTVVVIGLHEKQYERGFRDAETLLPAGFRLKPGIAVQPYWDTNRLNALVWALREILASRPGEFLQRHHFLVRSADRRLESLKVEYPPLAR